MEILSHIHNTYKKTRKKKFTAHEKRILRPIAETIAIMDGNAFFHCKTTGILHSGRDRRLADQFFHPSSRSGRPGQAYASGWIIG